MATDHQPVGYKRPPRHGQFRPGTSGNPGGRPRRLPSLITELEAELSEAVRIDEGGRAIEVSKQRAVLKALVRNALGGETRAAIALLSFAQNQSGQEDQAASDSALLEDYIEREIQRRVRKDEPERPASAETTGAK